MGALYRSRPRKLPFNGIISVTHPHGLDDPPKRLLRRVLARHRLRLHAQPKHGHFTP
jgi:hypothetical protein